MAQNPKSGKITKRPVDALTSEEVRFTLGTRSSRVSGVRVAVSDTKTYVDTGRSAAPIAFYTSPATVW